MSLFDRLKKISKEKGFKSINSFALEGLGYKSSEKLNRLKKEHAKPSADIIIDIANTFEDININWLLTGKGDMYFKNTHITDNQKLDKLSKEEFDVIHKAIQNYENELMEDTLFKKWFLLKKVTIENELMKAIYTSKKP